MRVHSTARSGIGAERDARGRLLGLSLVRRVVRALCPVWYEHRLVLCIYVVQKLVEWFCMLVSTLGGAVRLMPGRVRVHHACVQ